ncbi:MAG: hypothetical protein ACOYB2_09380 [Limnohabitans sp.]
MRTQFGYSKTPEGKLLAASLLDNFNRIVQQVRNKPLLVQATSASSQVNAQLSTRATPMAYAMPVQAAVVVQPTTVLVAQNGNASHASTFAGVFMKAAGSYSGRFAGQFSGTFTVQLSPDGKLNGWVHFENQPQFTLAGQINNTNGDFTLGGSTGPDNAMAMGRIDLNQFVMQGQWFLSKPTGGAPHANGSFAGKR